MTKQRELEIEEKIAKVEEKIDNLHVNNQDTQYLHLEQQLDEQKSEVERIRISHQRCNPKIKN